MVLRAALRVASFGWYKPFALFTPEAVQGVCTTLQFDGTALRTDVGYRPVVPPGHARELTLEWVDGLDARQFPKGPYKYVLEDGTDGPVARGYSPVPRMTAGPTLWWRVVAIACAVVSVVWLWLR